MKLFVCLHNQLGAISRLRYLSESASHLLSLPVSEAISQLPLPPWRLFIYLSIYLFTDLFICGGTSLPGRTWARRAPRARLLPARLALRPELGQGEAGAPSPPLAPARVRAGSPWAWPDTAARPPGCPPASSPQRKPQPPVQGEDGREAREGGRGTSPGVGGPGHGFEIGFHKASPSPKGPISSSGRSWSE